MSFESVEHERLHERQAAWWKHRYEPGFPWRDDLAGFAAWLEDNNYYPPSGDRFVTRYVATGYNFKIDGPGRGELWANVAMLEPRYTTRVVIRSTQETLTQLVMKMMDGAVFATDPADGQCLVTIAVDKLEECLLQLGLSRDNVALAVGRPLDVLSPITTPFLSFAPGEGDFFKRAKSQQIWGQMMEACYREGSFYYAMVGRRGVRVCQEWQDLPTFHKWVVETQPPQATVLAREDVRRDFEPENCQLI